jgi:glycosyltransferase involved in cell wall biosynthesis
MMGSNMQPSESFRGRVVHVTSVHQAGDTRIFLKECVTLARAGYDVHLVAPGTPNTVQNHMGVKVHSILGEASRSRRMIWAARRAVSLALTLEPDVLHLHDPELLPHVILARHRCRRIVFDMHEDLPKSLLSKSWLPTALRKPFAVVARHAERMLLSGIDVVFAEDSYTEGREWIKHQVTIRNLPIAARLCSVETTPATPAKLGYLGSVTPTRGCLTILHVLAELGARGVETGLECIGARPPEVEAETTRLVHHLGLRNVIFYGYMPADQGYDVLAKCSVGLALLHPVPNYISSYPTKMFEYMALGIPVVASNFPLYRSIIEDTGAGIVVDPQDVQAIAEVIASLLADPDRCREMGHRGREAVRTRYSWEGEAGRLTDLYANLVSRG